MPRAPEKGETQEHYMRYCVPFLIDTENMEQEQAVAYCMSVYERGKTFLRLGDEIHGLLCDMGVSVQRTTEFVDQEELVADFMKEWKALVEEIREDVIDQLDRGKRNLRV